MKYPLIPIFMIVSSISFTAIAKEEATSRNLSAEEQKSYDNLVQTGVTLYSAKRYEEAAEAFKAAFEIQSEPELAYNIARSYERIAKSESALEWYQKFIGMPGTTGELRAKALENMASLRKEIAVRKATAQADKTTADDADALTRESDTRKGEDSSASSKDMASDKMKPDPSADWKAGAPRKKIYLRSKIAGWWLTGIGLTVAATGGAFGVMAIQDKQEFDRAGNDPDKLEYRDNVQKNALLFDVMFTSGIAVTTIGISLLILYAVKNSSGGERLEATDEIRRNRASSPRVTPTVMFGNGIFAGALVAQF